MKNTNEKHIKQKKIVFYISTRDTCDRVLCLFLSEKMKDLI